MNEFKTQLTFDEITQEKAEKDFNAISAGITHGQIEDIADYSMADYIFEILCMAHSQLGESASEILRKNVTFQATIQMIQAFDWDNYRTFSNKEPRFLPPEQWVEFNKHWDIEINLGAVKDELKLKDRSNVYREAGIRGAQKSWWNSVFSKIYTQSPENLKVSEKLQKLLYV